MKIWRDKLDEVAVVARTRLGRSGTRGASLVEYALLVALIAIVCLSAVFFFGNETSDSFNSTASSISNA